MPVAMVEGEEGVKEDNRSGSVLPVQEGWEWVVAASVDLV
jgi:hypothetical protein